MRIKFILTIFALTLALGIPAYANEKEEILATREFMVNAMWEEENMPVINYAMTFDDVTEDYYNAVCWAEGKKLVSGIGENKFAPNKEITREQAAVILYRYALYKGKDVSVGENTNILSYKDYFDISEYAIPAMQWACGNGILTDTDGYIKSGDGISTKELAEMISKTINGKDTFIMCEIPEENISLIYEGGNDFIVISGEKSVKEKIHCLIDDKNKPKIYLDDLTGDGKEDICIITKAEKGNGLDVDGIIVLDKDSLEEYYVPSPFEIAESVVSFDEKNNKCIVSVGNQKYEILGLNSANDLVFSDVCRYKIKDGELTATLQFKTDPKSSVGTLRIFYVYSDVGFSVKTVTFKEA